MDGWSKMEFSDIIITGPPIYTFIFHSSCKRKQEWREREANGSQQRNPDAIVSGKEREPNESTFISLHYMKAKKLKDV